MSTGRSALIPSLPPFSSHLPDPEGVACDILRYMPNKTTSLDSIFHALADPTRRSVIERLSSGPASVSELAQPFAMALPSFLQHLRVLEESGLLRSVKVGRVRTCQIEPQALEITEEWLAEQRTLWERRLDQLDNYLRDLYRGDQSGSPRDGNQIHGQSHAQGRGGPAETRRDGLSRRLGDLSGPVGGAGKG